MPVDVPVGDAFGAQAGNSRVLRPSKRLRALCVLAIWAIDVAGQIRRRGNRVDAFGRQLGIG